MQILNSEHEFTTTINNVTYYIVIGFDTVSNAYGFVDGDSFHVYEGSLSEAAITGMLTASPPSATGE